MRQSFLPTAREIAAACEEHPVVDVTGCLAGYRVWLRGQRFWDFATLSDAARIASALTTFEALGLLDCVRSPGEVVRTMLEASVKGI